VLDARGEEARATTELEAALATLEAETVDDPGPRGEARCRIARRLWLTGEDRTRAERLLRETAEDLRSAKKRGSVSLEDVEAFLREHGLAP
jgi:hypothetical protein